VILVNGGTNGQEEAKTSFNGIASGTRQNPHTNTQNQKYIEKEKHIQSIIAAYYNYHTMLQYCV